MSELNENNDGSAENRATTADDDAARRAVDERIAELRAQGIIGGGEGPRGPCAP